MDHLRSAVFLLGTFSFAPLAGQVELNGPMVGHVDMLEANIWLQCSGPCTARIRYSADGDSVLVTGVRTSDPEKAHVLKFRLDRLVPATRYTYEVEVNGTVRQFPEQLTFSTQPLWKFRGEPPPFTLAMGSCTYVNEPAYDRPGLPYGSDLHIFNSIADERPDLMLWMGDNIYLREPDWGSRSGYLHRHTHTRSAPELQRLLRSTQHYAIWDDHDFGPNDADGSFINAPIALETFELFWANPTTGAPGVPGAITAFSHLDVDLFLLDDRTYRVNAENRTSDPAILGHAQLDWLIRALKYSDATFKLVAVGNQVLNTAKVFENFANYPLERSLLLERIQQEGISGVVFLSGDRHFTELSTLRVEGYPEIHDLTVSPLTSGLAPANEVNTLRVEGTLVREHNFATLGFSGTRAERVMTIRVFDADGELLWERAITNGTK